MCFWKILNDIITKNKDILIILIYILLVIVPIGIKAYEVISKIYTDKCESQKIFHGFLNYKKVNNQIAYIIYNYGSKPFQVIRVSYEIDGELKLWEPDDKKDVFFTEYLSNEGFREVTPKIVKPGETLKLMNINIQYLKLGTKFMIEDGFGTVHSFQINNQNYETLEKIIPLFFRNRQG